MEQRGTYRVESKTFEVKMNQAFNKNERLLKQVISKDIVNLIVNSSMDFASVNVHECEKCLKLETELQKDFIEKEIYDKQFKRDNSISNQSAPSLIIIELMNESSAPKRKTWFNRSEEKVLVITTLKDKLSKLKGKDLANNEVIHHPSDPEINTEPITPKLLNKRSAHAAYIKHTQEEAAVLRITTTTEAPLRKLVVLDNETSKPAVTLVYSRKPRNSKTNVPVSKSKVLQSVSANKKEPSKSWGSIISDVPSSSLNECRSSKLSSGIRLGCLQAYDGDIALSSPISSINFWIGNVMISRVYYVEGLGHNLFSVGQFCDSNLEVAFRQHTCFIRNLEGVDLLTGSRGNNLYTLSLGRT
ncbi:hypothetical protein Tco_0475710 [Tanacetum coccineum]